MHDGDTAGLVVVDSTAEKVSGWRAERRWLDSTRESALLKSSIFIFSDIFSGTKDQIRNEAAALVFSCWQADRAHHPWRSRHLLACSASTADGLLDTHKCTLTTMPTLAK